MVEVVGKYRRSRQPGYARTIQVYVKPTKYERKGKTVKRKGYTYRRLDVGKPGKGPKLIVVKEKGALRKHGYNVKKSEVARHQALASAVKEYGALSVYRKLNAQYVFRKRYDPVKAGIFKSDAEWVKETYKPDGFVS